VPSGLEAPARWCGCKWSTQVNCKERATLAKQYMFFLVARIRLCSTWIVKLTSAKHKPEHKPMYVFVEASAFVSSTNHMFLCSLGTIVLVSLWSGVLHHRSMDFVARLTFLHPEYNPTGHESIVSPTTHWPCHRGHHIHRRVP